MTEKGKFITLEGSEGAGKTTNMLHIKTLCESKGHRVICTREPGGTEISEKIRELLLDKNNRNFYPDTELLLMFASRSQHLNELIIPALNRGDWVISDRFTDASFAYQGGGRGMSWDRINTLRDWVQGDLRPDLTLLFDLPVKIGMARAKKRGPSDRFEEEQLSFFDKVRQGYYRVESEEKKRFKIIDANKTEQQVKKQVEDVVSNFILR
ncbi:MAG: dTMP kinase [Pseudomonadota bacterium]